MEDVRDIGPIIVYVAGTRSEKPLEKEVPLVRCFLVESRDVRACQPGADTRGREYPEKSAEDKYRVIATGCAPLEVGLLTIKWRSTASADFELLIDTSENQLLSWKIMPKSLKVIPSQETEQGVEKVKGWFQDFFKR